MDKQTAAKLLGVGIRAVERYAEQGRLTVRYEKGKTRPVAAYDADEVKALKAELDAAHYHIRPAVTALEQVKPANPEQPASGLVAIGNAETSERFAALLEAVRPPAATIGEKILLDLKDCQTLTGLSKPFLTKAINAKQLKGGKLGKGYKIKRADLDDFVKKLKL